MIARGAVVEHAIAVRGHGPHAAGQSAIHFLIDRTIIGWVELAHVGSVHEIQVAVLAGTYGELPRVAAAIHHVRQHDRATGAEVDVTGAFTDCIVHREI